VCNPIPEIDMGFEIVRCCSSIPPPARGKIANGKKTHLPADLLIASCGWSLVYFDRCDAIRQ
jgi:hypothetical protein